MDVPSVAMDVASVANPHQACRSLLRKAERRGDVALLLRVAAHLAETGQGSWLRARAEEWHRLPLVELALTEETMTLVAGACLCRLG